MHILLAVGVTILAAQAPAQSALAATRPLDIVMLKASFEEALSVIASQAGVVIEIDQSVDAATRQSAIADGPMRLNSSELTSTIDWLTAARGLSYSIVGPKAIRIYKKA